MLVLLAYLSIWRDSWSLQLGSRRFEHVVAYIYLFSDDCARRAFYVTTHQTTHKILQRVTTQPPTENEATLPRGNEQTPDNQHSPHVLDDKKKQQHQRHLEPQLADRKAANILCPSFPTPKLTYGSKNKMCTTPAVDGHPEPPGTPLDPYLLRLHPDPLPLGLPKRQPDLLPVVLPRVGRDLLRPPSLRRRRRRGRAAPVGL